MQQISHYNEVRFIILFAAWYGVFYSAYFLIPDSVLNQYLHHDCIITIAAHFINQFFPAENIHELSNTLTSSKASIEVVRGCDGSGTVFLLIAAMFSFRSSVKQKTSGALLALFLIYAINMFRIVGLYFILAYHKHWFQMVHTYLLPTLIVILCGIFFLWWTRLPALSRSTDEPSIPA